MQARNSHRGANASQPCAIFEVAPAEAASTGEALRRHLRRERLSRRGGRRPHGRLGPGRIREVRAPHTARGRRRLALGVTEHVLGLGSVLVGVRLERRAGPGRVVAGEVADLLRLRVDQVAGVADLLVNGLLVGAVDQRTQEESGGAHQAETPERRELDEEVAQRGGNEGLHAALVHVPLLAPTRTYRKCDEHVLGEQNALELDDEEVDELLRVLQRRLEALTRDGIVAPGTDAGQQALGQDELANTLGDRDACVELDLIKLKDRRSLTAEDPGRRLENERQDGHVARREDRRNDAQVRNGRRTRVVPAQEIVEERMVVWSDQRVSLPSSVRQRTRQVLARGRGGRRSLAGALEALELIPGLGSLVQCSLSDWSWRDASVSSRKARLGYD